MTNPIVPENKLCRNTDGRTVNATTYKQLIGSLMYLNVTRHDLMFAVCLENMYMERPTKTHLVVVKRILRYVKGPTSLSILYKKQADKRQHQGELIGFKDFDYAGDFDDRRSISGYVYMLGSAAVSWSSKKQSVVTLSTTEAEFIAAAGSCQGVWLRRILNCMGKKEL